MGTGGSDGTSISKQATIGALLLVTDDDEFGARLRRIARESLQRPSLWQVDSVETALDQVAGHDIGLAVFDLDMPGAPAPGALSELHGRCRDTRLVVLCGEIGAGALLRYIAAGVHGCILRTDADAVVASRLRDALRGDLSIPETPDASGDAAAPSGHREEAADREPADNRVAPQLLGRLTERQRTVLVLLVEGMTNKEISRELLISTRTVKMHLSAIYRELGVQNRTQALSVLFRSRQP